MTILLSDGIGASGGLFAILGQATVTITGNADVTLSTAQIEVASLMVTSDGASTGLRRVQAPVTEQGVFFLVKNNTTEAGHFPIAFGGTSGALVTIPWGASALCYCADGANYVCLGLTSSAQSTWTTVAAGATITVQAGQSPSYYSIDASAAQVTFNLPAVPIDGQEVIFTISSATTNANVKIVAGVGTAVWNPGNPGNFSGAGGPVGLGGQGTTFKIKFQAATSKWIQA